ncbi:MAG TPA: LUD domain-containing protein [Ohtaekwangia sp.]|nr:LUD domain-containing protein [Ohtaekwangia sp.]
MSARDIMLKAVAGNQPDLTPLPDEGSLELTDGDHVSAFIALLEGIGGQVIRVNSYAEIEHYIRSTFTGEDRVVTTCPQLTFYRDEAPGKPHALFDVDLAVLESDLAVAENGAVWIANLSERVTPFICQHLAVIVAPSAIVADLHHAYDKIASMDYDFGVFIAGPSKTADIEQSLVLGAHGPKTMTVFLFQADSFPAH